MIKYRADIDGLRAIAVLPVIFFHAGYSAFSGGFVGVDVFFVISGYLITSVVMQEILSGKFSFLIFFARRTRRIFPALLAVLIFCTIAGFNLLLPRDYGNLGEAMRRIASFTSNHLFWHVQNDYWRQNTLAVQPLLHTWSLAIEEQFYLALPLMLWGLLEISKRGSIRTPVDQLKPSVKPILGILLVLAIFSFAASNWLLSTDRSAAFYLLPSRAWELLIGSLLAVASISNLRFLSIPYVRNLIGFIGMALLGYSIFAYSKETEFPGIAALAPCLGAASIILSGIQADGNPPFASRLLSSRPLVFIGLISYSLYLWHWPILVFYRSIGWQARELPQIPVWGLLLVILLVSMFSWRFIEKPFRNLRGLQSQKLQTIYFGIISLALCFFVGIQIHSIGNDGTPIAQSPPPIVQQLVKDLETYPGIRCEGRTDIQDVASTGGGCLLGAARDRNPSFALVGDSHARMWVEAINAKAKSRERAGLGLAHSSCIPLVGITPPTRKECLEISESKIKFLENSTIRDVVLAGYWLEIAHTSQGVIDFQHSLEKTVERLKHANKRVFVMADVPELANDQAVQQLALKSLHEDGKLSYGLSIKQHLDKQGQINAVIASLAKKQNFIVLDPAQIICSTKGCLSAKEGETLYRDKHHLTDKGGIYFKNVFNPLFDIAPENTI